MKKILGISLVAVLAVSPMMAYATGELGAAVSIGSQNTVNNGDDGVFAAQSYVKGAYNAVMGDLANVNNAVTKLNANEDTEGSVLNAIKTAVSASEKSAGAGLVDGEDNALDVNVDGTTVVIENDTVKVGTVAKTNLASDVQDSLGLADSALQASDIAAGVTGGTIKVGDSNIAVGTDSDHRFVTDTQISTWGTAATAVANYTSDLADKQDKDKSTVSAEQAAAHTSLTAGDGVANNLASVAGVAEGAASQAGTNAEAIAVANRRLIPVATGWANNNGADTTTNVQFSALGLATLPSNEPVEPAGE